MIDRFDCIKKQKLNIILLVDVSKSMQGSRIKQVNEAITDITKYLSNYEDEISNIEFYLTVITFGNTANYLNERKTVRIKDYSHEMIKVGGYSNLHLCYSLLDSVLEKESKGGIMSDFGGIAPIIILLTDGHPTKGPYEEMLDKLKKKPWFKVALKYGIAVELDDKLTMKILRDFVGNSGDVISCYDSSLLKKIIKIVVVTSSKVNSQCSLARSKESNQNEEAKVIVNRALAEIDDWEW